MSYRNMSWNILELDKSLAAVTSKSNCSQFAFHKQPKSTGAGCVVKHCSRGCCSNTAAQTRSQRCGSLVRGKYFIKFSADVKGPGQKTIMDWAELPSSLRRYLMLWVGIRVAEQPPCSSKSGSKTWRALGTSITCRSTGYEPVFSDPPKLLLSRDQSEQQEQVSAVTYGSTCTYWHPAQTNRSLAACQVSLQGDRKRHPAEDSAYTSSMWERKIKSQKYLVPRPIQKQTNQGAFVSW